MPNNPVLVINIEDNQPIYMHSIDASEAIRLGDYRPATMEELASSTPEKAAALNRMRAVNVNPPPELQTPEQKAAIRAAANEEAARIAAAQEHYAAGESLGVRQALGVAPAGSPPGESHPAAPASTPTPSEPARGGRRSGSD